MSLQSILVPEKKILQASVCPTLSELSHLHKNQIPGQCIGEDRLKKPIQMAETKPSFSPNLERS